MSTRLETLQRLMNLYTAVEQMHSTELQRLTTAVREAQQAIAVEQSVAQTARIDGREALTAGDRVGWMMAETQQETAGWRTQRLEEIRVERQELNDAAREQIPHAHADAVEQIGKRVGEFVHGAGPPGD